MAEEKYKWGLQLECCGLYIASSNNQERHLMTIALTENLKHGLTNKGKIGVVALDELKFGVVIKDVRVRFGHLDYLISPLSGDGAKWVEHHRVTIK